jgi:nitrogen regulatory protein PII 2
MKEVMAIIRMNKINDTKRALAENGYSQFTGRKVMGRGRGPVDAAVAAGAKAGSEEALALLGRSPRLFPKRLLTVVVPDNKVKGVVDTIIKVNRTGHAGDGKIFVIPLQDAVRVRTGESGDLALDEIA